MTLPDKTDPSRPRKKPGHQRPARPVNSGQRPAPRHTHEDVAPADRQLYYALPDKKLQHRTLQWVGAALIAGLACVCVVAIAVGSVPTALVAAIAILAMAARAIVRYVFPRAGQS